MFRYWYYSTLTEGLRFFSKKHKIKSTLFFSPTCFSTKLAFLVCKLIYLFQTCWKDFCGAFLSNFCFWPFLFLLIHAFWYQASKWGYQSDVHNKSKMHYHIWFQSKKQQRLHACNVPWRNIKWLRKQVWNFLWKNSEGKSFCSYM